MKNTNRPKKLLFSLIFFVMVAGMYVLQQERKASPLPGMLLNQIQKTMQTVNQQVNANILRVANVKIRNYSLTVSPHLPAYSLQMTYNPASHAVLSIAVFKRGNSSPVQIIADIPSDELCLPSRDIEAEDFNFDGYKDISLPVSCGATGNVSYNAWLFNPSTGTFVLNKELSNVLANWEIHPRAKEITMYWTGGLAGRLYTKETYEFRHGKLVKVRDEEQKLKDDDELDKEAESHKYHFVKIIRQRKNGKMALVSRKQITEEI